MIYFSKRGFLIWLFLTLFNATAQDKYPPKGFVYVHEVIPNVHYDIRYAGEYNFIGEPIDGYENPVALLTSEAAAGLKKASKILEAQGFELKIFDAYRPQRAVNQFMSWARVTNDARMKEEFYPEVNKKDLFNLGYIASRSGHTRGSTVDLSLVNKGTGREVDMGSAYDFFGPISHHGTTKITPQQTRNREILMKAMQQAGFRAYPQEWWHYTLRKEPFPETYFDFPVR